MWWILFTAVDLYVGLVILDLMAKSLPAEKLPKLARARKVIVVLLVMLGVALVGVLIRRHV